MANLSDLVGFALTVTAHYDETRVESSFSTAPTSSRLELPGFQIEHQIT